jgi:hypothetical protein
MYQAGGSPKQELRKYWQKWYPDVSQQIIKSQNTTGQQRGGYRLDENYGVWSTGMCALILGIPYRYLPIYQR